MCVILIADSRRLTDSMIDSAVDANPDGNGLAWIESGAVRFVKGLTLRDAQDIASDVPLPYIFHARIATIGGIRPELCHPFPLDRRVNPVALSGRSTRGVLFHNGHWGAWEEFVERGDGPWSDSRAMAEHVSEHGTDRIPKDVGTSQRVAVLTRHGVSRFGAGWTETARGVWASNTIWKERGLPTSWRQILKNGQRQQQLLINPAKGGAR